uniref:Tetratricopeptide repeat-containing protein n=1 Tax=Spironucleus salmonicida TaxID=348837 RepID=V6M7K3_9EUKA|eukprot:EST49439.1 Hypothetical protein SS50377_10186 [Spironucleus salmonicida]
MDTKSFLRNGMVLMRECEYDEACECFIPACIQICSLIPCLIQIPELQIYIESTASEIQHIQAAFNCLSILAFAQYKAGHYSTASIVSTQLIRLLSRHGVLSHHALFNNIIYARSNAPMSAVSHCRRLQMDSSTRARASYELGMCYLDSDEDLAMEQFQLSNSLGYQMAEHAICELLHKKNLLDAKRARVNAKHCPGKRLFVKVLLHLNLQEPASKECRHMLQYKQLQIKYQLTYQFSIQMIYYKSSQLLFQKKYYKLESILTINFLNTHSPRSKLQNENTYKYQTLLSQYSITQSFIVTYTSYKFIFSVSR